MTHCPVWIVRNRRRCLLAFVSGPIGSPAQGVAKFLDRTSICVRLLTEGQRRVMRQALIGLVKTMSARFPARFPLVWSVGRHKGRIAVTFDDGPTDLTL